MDQTPARPGATLERLHASRREFLTRIAQASAALGGSAIAGSAVAQAPADAGAGIPNATIMAGKDSVLAIHSERPLTASVPAEHHNFLVTPTRRMFVRNNLNTPDIDASKHVLTVRGLVDRELTLTLDDLAARMGMSTAHFQRVFSHWVGVSPKRYQQYLTLDLARRLLSERHSVLETSLATGLSGGGRLHDLFLRWEAKTPGDYALGGAGLRLVSSPALARAARGAARRIGNASPFS
jgi:AraC-like DNA-binding protein